MHARFGQDFPGLAVVAEIFAAVFEDEVHQVVFLGCGLGNDDVALLVEHPRDGAGFGHVAAVLAEGMSDFADGAVAIVGADVDQYRSASGTVSLERELFVVDAGEFAGTTLNGALDVVGRHVLGLRIRDGLAQAGVLIHVAAILRRDGDFLDQARENLAAFRVKSALLVLDCGPL